MPMPEGIYVARVMPAEAADAALEMQSFLAGSTKGVEPNTAVHYTWADPQNPELVADMEAEIQASGRLDRLNQMAYIIARDPSFARHGGVVGFGTFSRVDEVNVLVDGLYVAPRYRGRHIGPAILDAALTELDITTVDHLTADVAETDLRTKRFWERIGFIPEPLTHTHPEGHPSGDVPHREYTGRQLFVEASLRAVLGI